MNRLHEHHMRRYPIGSTVNPERLEVWVHPDDGYASADKSDDEIPDLV